jgi:ABC-type transporter Mla subunit MlaD
MDALGGELSDGAFGVQQAGEAAAQAAVDVAQSAETAQGELEAAVETAAEAASALADAADEARDAASEAASDLSDTLRDLLDDARDRMARTADTLADLASGHEGEVEAQGGALSGGAEALVEEVRTRVESDLRSAVAALVDALGASFRELAERVEQCRDVVRADGEAVGSLFTSLREEMAPLPGAIESVRTAAAKVGIPWSAGGG